MGPWPTFGQIKGGLEGGSGAKIFLKTNALGLEERIRGIKLYL